MANGELTRPTSDEERRFVRALAEGHGPDRHAARRAKLILSLIDGADLREARRHANGMSNKDAQRWVAAYNDEGWKGLLAVRTPRGGDFLARYDNGYWAERLVTNALDSVTAYRAIPYGTSRSEPFTDFAAFRQYVLGEFALQAWSAAGRWKRPDLLSLPRQVLVEERGNDLWSPDLQHWDNSHCEPYVSRAAAAFEVETSLWDVQRALAAQVPLSFTIKDEDLESLKRWIEAAGKPLYVVQVFFDRAYALPFGLLLELIQKGQIEPRVDDQTGKATYFVPLQRGLLIGTIPTPEVEGRIYVASNGCVTVYGRLTGSEIVPVGDDVLPALMAGTLAT